MRLGECRLTKVLGSLVGLSVLFFALGLYVGTSQEGTGPARFRNWLANVQSGRPAAAAPAPNLKSVETLWEVLDSLKKHFVEESLDQGKLTDGAINGILGELGDRHTRYMDPKAYREFKLQNAGEFDGIGAKLGIEKDEKTGDEWLTIHELIGESPAKVAGVRAGDRIIEINGESTKGMSVDEAATLIRGPRDTEVQLTVTRLGRTEPLKVKIVRKRIELPAVVHELLEGGLGWVQIQQFNERTEEMLDAALADLRKQKMKAVILDVRNDPGGLLDAAVGVASRFIQKGTIVITRGRDGEEKLTAIQGQYAKLNMPLCILVNQYSASASEILAGAIQDHGLGKVIGTKTYGKASVQVVITLKNDGALALTTAKYLTPKERDINQTGITPDIEVQASHDGETTVIGRLQESILQMKEDLSAAGIAHDHAEQVLAPIRKEVEERYKEIAEDVQNHRLADPQLRRAIEEMKRELAGGRARS